ncbi:hypothetical protein V1477_017149, partial [Vespula maculifrons]
IVAIAVATAIVAITTATAAAAAAVAETGARARAFAASTLRLFSDKARTISINASDLPFARVKRLNSTEDDSFARRSSGNKANVRASTPVYERNVEEPLLPRTPDDYEATTKPDTLSYDDCGISFEISYRISEHVFHTNSKTKTHEQEADASTKCRRIFGLRRLSVSDEE